MLQPKISSQDLFSMMSGMQMFRLSAVISSSEYQFSIVVCFFSFLNVKFRSFRDEEILSLVKAGQWVLFVG